MAQLLVRNISEELVKALKVRAAENGVSAEEEHRRILAAAMSVADRNVNVSMIRSLLHNTSAEEIDDADDWVFDRNDSRNATPLRKDQGLLDD